MAMRMPPPPRRSSSSNSTPTTPTSTKGLVRTTSSNTTPTATKKIVEETTGSHHVEESSSLAAAATASLELLLREDRLLTQHNMHVLGNDEAVFSYTSQLLKSNDEKEDTIRATQALEDVNRKLALVESLAERVSRNSPQAVAGPLLRLHGYSIIDSKAGEEEEDNNSSSTTLTATRERCHRLQRQGQVLESVAKRVESSLERGLQRMTKATTRLSRVLDLNLVLKQILRLQFESSKLQGYDLDDLRDLTRVAASVAVLQDLLQQPQLNCGIELVERMRPSSDATLQQVRTAASQLLQQHQQRGSAMLQLGATLQVYYHLSELPQAAWSAVQHGLQKASDACQDLFSTRAIAKLQEEAATLAKQQVGKSHKPGDTERVLKIKLRELRAQAASTWASQTLEAVLQVWSLHLLLLRKTDPVTRRSFVHVVSEAPIPHEYKEFQNESEDFSLFRIFWLKLCHELGERLQALLKDNAKLDVAGLYPAVRAASLEMTTSLHDTMQASGKTLSLEDTSDSTGILGGSAGLDNALFQYSMEQETTTTSSSFMASADSWTRATNDASSLYPSNATATTPATNTSTTKTTTLSLSFVFSSAEWKALQGNEQNQSGLFSLHQAFLQASKERLCKPLQYMFPSTDEKDGVPISVLPTLPSRFDLQKLDLQIRQELSLADPREGGGELTMTPMICNVVVDMVKLFSQRAKGVVSGAGEERFLEPSGWIVPTSDLIHDLKVSNVMSALATALRTAPENTFVVPYRPATSVQHEEAANMCQTALVPALNEIENTVKTLILGPLCRALNRRVANAIAKVHHGTYLSENAPDGSTGTSFVEKNLQGLYEGVADNILSKLPTEYASIVASTVATYSVYNFRSNIALIRPLSETARLHITQDLADFELALEQLVFKGNSSKTLSQMQHGKPYAELRAVRQMLFWTGLDEADATPASLTKSILREVWIKDVRPSTVIHFLFSFAPPLLSSPHHAKRTSPETYVETLVRLDASVDDGEASAWMVAMECCDSFQQRESVGSSKGGDARVAAILMSLGPELLRRRRH